MLNRVLFTVMAMTMVSVADAKVRLSHLVGDNMILQQNCEARLWGWDAPGKTVRVTTSWSSDVYSVKADAKGKWLVRVRTPKASYTPLSVTFDDGEKTTIGNILAGEVWLCTGQSNMEMPMKGYVNCPVEGYNEEMVNAHQFRNIHYCTLPMAKSETPRDDTNCRWRVIGPQTVGGISAVGYYFAQTLQRALDIPVGIIVAVKGGSRVEGWLDYDNLKKYTDEPLDFAEMAQKYPRDYMRPLIWGNGTICPVHNYTFKGILFYQGCSNSGLTPHVYAERLELLAKQWRRDFALGEIPFYITQIAPFAHGNDPDGEQRARLLEQQMEAANAIPRSGIVCTQDQVYPWESRQIHPSQKRQIGYRLGYHALNKEYGIKSIQCESPKFESMTVSGDTCYVKFKDVYNGITQCDTLEGFEVAGADRVFHKAVGHVKKGGMIYVLSKEVPKPVAVRYCFRNWQSGNVTNSALLPLFPFRSDNW